MVDSLEAPGLAPSRGLGHTLHTALSLVSAVLLAHMGITAALHVILYSVLPPESTLPKTVIKLHTGSYFGQTAGTWFPIIVGFILIIQALSGVVLNGLRVPTTAVMIKVRGVSTLSWRKLHNIMTFTAGPFLLITLVSGWIYRIARRLLEADKEQVGWLMEWHTMEVFGLGILYPIVMGAVAVVVAWSGFQLRSQAVVSDALSNACKIQ